jgi:hypothetical protein
VGKPEGNRELERPRHRWENIKMNLKGNKTRDVDCINLDWDSDQYQVLSNRVIKLRVA